MESCDTESKPSSGATLFNNEEVHAAVKAMVDAVDQLQANIGRFDDENWRDVVPDVRSAAANCGDAVTALRQALGYSDA
jgi:hypothetical protein